MEQMLLIVGVFGTLALSINAFFLRGIYQDLNLLRIQFATMTERSEAKEKRIENLEVNEKEIFDRLNKIERSI